jgi:hypothetical protein
MKRIQIICDGEHKYPSGGLVIDPAERVPFSVQVLKTEHRIIVSPGIGEGEGIQHHCSRSCASLFIDSVLEKWEEEASDRIEAQSTKPAPAPPPQTEVDGVPI